MAAIAIVSMASLFSLRTIQAASKATLRVQSTDRAVSFAYDMLERARAFGCGTEAYNEPAIVSRDAGCGGLGVASFTRVDESGKQFVATVYTRWGSQSLVPGAAGCGHFATAPATPSILARTVEVSYPQGNARGVRTIRLVESVPPDAIAYNSQVRSGIVIATAPNADVQMLNPAGKVIKRRADSRGCAWFPFLPVGSSPSFNVGSCAWRVEPPPANPRENRVVTC